MIKDFILPDVAEQIFAPFKKAGYKIYLVGGAVRDILLKKPVYDCDFTTNATPPEIEKLFDKTVYNNTYGTVTVILKQGEKVEITPFRKEAGYLDHRHPQEVVWAKTLQEDLERRDFTINAMAHDGERIFDPHGGLTDLKNKTICAVGDADKRFNEDGLRLIRAVRFASQLGFFIEDKTLESIRKNSDLIKHVSWERIRDEFLKIIGSDHPGDGILLLKNVGLLSHILPEVETCFGVEQKSPERHHVFDVGTHLIESLNACQSKNVITRFAVLLHDVGKAKTYSKDPNTNVITFYNHEIVGADMATDIAERFRLSNKDRNTLVTLVRYHMFTVSEEQTDSAIRRFIKNVGKENLQEAILLRVADRIGSGAKETSWRTELFKKRLIEVQKQPFSVKDLKITGHDVMKILKIKPSPKVGEILNKLFNEVVENGLKNDRKELFKVLKNN